MILSEHDLDHGVLIRIPSPGRCIYCGQSGVELTDEHVVPYAIAKNTIILEKSCCLTCQKTIQPYEQEVLRKQLGVFRAMVEAPTRNKKERPKSAFLPFVEVDNSGRAIRELGVREVTIEDAPLILNLWQSPPPRILGIPFDPAYAEGRPWRYVERPVADRIGRRVAEETGCKLVGIKLDAVDRMHYLRVLAKIAHAYAASGLGLEAFEPFLTDLILCKSDDVGKYVGDLSGVASLEGPTQHTFKMTLGEVPEGPAQGMIAVFIQLWSDLGTPPHLIVVGKALTDIKSLLAKRS